MLIFVFCIFLFFAIIFGTILLKERRNLYSGIFFMLTSLSLAIYLIFVVFKYSESIQASDVGYFLIQALTLFVLACVVFVPILVVLSFFYSAAFIIRREGFTFRNLLSLSFGIALIIYIFVWPRIANYTYGNLWINSTYVYIGLIILYFLFVATVYTISSFINMINIFPRKLDYVVVLGAGLIGEKVTPLLASRIRKGISIYQKNPGSKLIMSGGQGPDEIVPEALAMKNYALEQGVREIDIIMEDKSKNTEENIKFSYKLMRENTKFALVTNYYHVFRALILARSQNIKCIGYGAPTKFYFSLNAFIREFIGYLYLKRKRHIIILLLCTILFFGAVIAMEIYARHFY